MDSTVSDFSAIPATDTSVLARFWGRSDESESESSESESSESESSSDPPRSRPDRSESEDASSSSDASPNTATPVPSSSSPASFRSFALFLSRMSRSLCFSLARSATSASSLCFLTRS